MKSLGVVLQDKQTDTKVGIKRMVQPYLADQLD